MGCKLPSIPWACLVLLLLLLFVDGHLLCTLFSVYAGTSAAYFSLLFGGVFECTRVHICICLLLSFATRCDARDQHTRLSARVRSGFCPDRYRGNRFGTCHYRMSVATREGGGGLCADDEHRLFRWLQQYCPVITESTVSHTRMDCILTALGFPPWAYLFQLDVRINASSRGGLTRTRRSMYG